MGVSQHCSANVLVDCSTRTDWGDRLPTTNHVRWATASMRRVWCSLLRAQPTSRAIHTQPPTAAASTAETAVMSTSGELLRWPEPSVVDAATSIVQA